MLDLFDFRFTKLLHGMSTRRSKNYSCLIKLKIHHTRNIFKIKILITNCNELITNIIDMLILHFVAIWQRYEYFKSDKFF